MNSQNQSDIERKLADDVRLLGSMLGDVLKTQGSPALFETVEAMRTTAKRAREATDPSARQAEEAELSRLAQTLDPENARAVVKAFTLYFRLVNVAEDVHRTRVIRSREMANSNAGKDSFPEVIQKLVADGASREELLEVLQEIRFSCVFTAHPTEARRRTTQRLLRDVRVALERRDRHELTPIKLSETERRMRASVESLFAHGAVRRERPEVLEEVKAGLWYLEDVLMDAMPVVYRRLADALERHTSGAGRLHPADLPTTLQFGSWMGADRDGNPYVTDAVTERTLEMQRRVAIDRYVADLGKLVDTLSATDEHLPLTSELRTVLERCESALPELINETRGRNPNEPYRRLITLMRERLRRAWRMAPGAYANAESFLDDLQAVRSSVLAGGATAIADDRLLDLIIRVRTFGFELCRLDVREDGRVHRRCVAELLDDPSYIDATPEARLEALRTLRLPARDRTLSQETRRLLELFQSLRRLHGRFGSQAIGTYIISMCETAADVMEVLTLAQLHGVTDLDVVPLFETRHALQDAPAALESLLSNPDYRAHVTRRGDLQEVLVGYSDSMKDAGILASRIAVLTAQRQCAAVCDKHSVTLQMFHGRGGSVSRGGGPTHRAILALPPEAFSGRIKITEQGEMRAVQFGNPDLAVRYLEQVLAATLRKRWEARRGLGKTTPEDADRMAQLANESFKAYRGLVDDDGLLPYFLTATPLDQIASLNIASRPAKRGKKIGLGDLRAIPWVFAWSQCRHVITGWYGVGSALQSVDAETLKPLLERSTFFRDLLDNVQMTLSKADMGIAARYAELCPDRDIRARIFGMVKDEHSRAKTAVLEILGDRHLLDSDPTLQKSIALRNPYVDPISYLQIHAMQRHATVENEDEKAAWAHVVSLAIKGISAGVRITG